MIAGRPVALLLSVMLLPFGGTAHRETERGNRHYLDGALDEALRAYTEAQVSLPDAPQLYYDIGNVLFRQGDYEQAADALGKSRVAVSNLLRLLNLTPHVRKALAEKKIEMGHARALLPLNPDRQIMLCEKIARESLSVREVEALVNGEDRSAFAKPSNRKKEQTKDADVQAIENELSDQLGFSVKINNKKNNSGEIRISYRNLDQLDVLIEKLKN